VDEGRRTTNSTVDAIGPETFSYRGLVETVGEIIGKRRRVVSLPPALGYAAGWILGKFVRDVVVTREEIQGLMADLLHVDSPPMGTTRLSDWARAHAATLGLRYTSELSRRRDRVSAYRSN
jgi:NADH dehydrogenase